MNILSKSFLVLLTVSIFIFLIFVTYLTNSFSDYEKPYYENIEKWNYLIEENIDWSLYLEKNDDWLSNLMKINTSDKIIYSSWQIELIEEEWKKIIKLSKGIYFFDLRELNSQYIIKWDWFEIKNSWPGFFVINTINSRKNTIFSINTLLNLKFINFNNWEEMTNSFLYPHTYLVFNPIKNIFIKNWDLLKVSQTFSLWDFDEQIIIDWEINNNFLDIVSLKEENDKEIIINAINLIKQDYKNDNEIINNFSSSNFLSLAWENFILKYSDFFINPSKKSTYLKNIITRKLQQLINSPKDWEEIIKIILSNLEELEKIDSKWASEIKDVIEFYYSIVIKDVNDFDVKFNLAKLESEINNKNSNLKFKSLISLEKTFFKYDFLENKNLYKDIIVFKNEYLKDLDIEIWNNINESSISNLEKIDYFLLFLENILTNADFSSENIDANDLITIFSDYVSIADYFYNTNNNTIKRTWLYNNSQILNLFIEILENRYFSEERNENGLIEIKENIKINKENIIILENSINNLISFFNDYKNILDEAWNNKDKFLIKLYSILSEKYEEYFLALKSYDEYLIKYDKSKEELLTSKTINENENNIVLSKENAINYLKVFNWLNLNSANIQVMDYNYCLNPIEENASLNIEVAYCYKIDNLNLSWKNLSFLLHPFENNKIDEIILDWEIKTGSYKLNDIKETLDIQKESETINKDQYDFANFLLFTFSDNQIVNNNETYENNDSELEEDSVVKVFKRNKLLWETWDFNILKGFIDINYNDLIVDKIWEEYLINIKLWIFNITVWKNLDYYWEISSEYNFNPKHSFINPQIKIIDIKSKKEYLSWNKIKINWEYKVTNIKKEIEDVFNEFTKINYITESIVSNLRTSEINISFDKETKIINFELNYNSENLNIELNNWYITKIIYKWTNLIQEKIDYKDLSQYLNNIN